MRTNYYIFVPSECLRSARRGVDVDGNEIFQYVREGFCTPSFYPVLHALRDQYWDVPVRLMAEGEWRLESNFERALEKSLKMAELGEKEEAPYEGKEVFSVVWFDAEFDRKKVNLIWSREEFATLLLLDDKFRVFKR
jgi:hypothetical protein